MDLLKTTILPTDDKRFAAKMFHDLVFERPHVLLVVMGKGPEADVFVERADRFAGRLDGHRWVIWARKPEMIQIELQQLQGDGKLLAKLPGARGFSLSLSDEVRDVIDGTEPVPDQFRVFQAYARAEASQ